ncbi:MAG: hypothetical protein R3C56_25035 [Pirellulaceae bacterium]
MFTAADALIAETKVSEVDEWSLDAVLPEDGEVRLQVTDLLQRGGAKYTYALEIAPASTFAVAIGGCSAGSNSRSNWNMERRPSIYKSHAWDMTVPSI